VKKIDQKLQKFRMPSWFTPLAQASLACAFLWKKQSKSGLWRHKQQQGA
jgi:hypothetical protein